MSGANAFAALINIISDEIAVKGTMVDSDLDEQWHFAEQHRFTPGGITAGGRATEVGQSWRNLP